LAQYGAGQNRALVEAACLKAAELTVAAEGLRARLLATTEPNDAFIFPLTPGGKSALATLPPWHYSSDCIAIEYWADPAAIAALLPPGLTPDEKSSGRAFFWFLLWKAAAILYQGCVAALTGKAPDAVQKISSGLTAWRSTGATLLAPFYLSCLAGAYAAATPGQNAF